MKLPKRPKQHILETASYKLFASKIPDEWIIRDITERDYGIDCYLELVNENNELSGDLALIQLKSKDKIDWNDKDTFTHYGVDISTTNYWNQFPIPVFIFVGDITKQELYFNSVQYSIKRNFDQYVKQTNFHYKFRKSDIFEGKGGVFSFKFSYYYERYRSQFENELLFFLSNLEHYKDFQRLHNNLDYHLGLEDTDLIYFESMHRNFEFLCIYLNIDNPIPKLKEIKKKSLEKFGNEHHYELYEHDLTDWMEEYERLTIEIIKGLKSFLDGELSYWIRINPTVFNYINNIGDDGTLPYQ